MKRIGSLLMLALLGGCSLVPEFHAPEMPTPAWRGAPVTAEAPEETDWWGRFGSAELSALVAEALVGNNDVNAAAHRADQAHASARIAAASLWPTADANANAGRTFSDPGAANAYRGGVDVGYELDLFGRNRAGAAAAQASAQASEYDRDALALVVAGDTAEAFVGLLALDDRLRVARDNLANVKDVLRITQVRHDAGALSGLELAQQKALLATSESALAALVQQREALLDQLAVLAGKPPQDFRVAAVGLEGLTVPDVAPVQPAELLTRRPDIRAAEAQLAAANYNIGAARAAFFPNFQLSATAALAANPASAAAALTSALAAAVSAPVFSGGALEGGLALSTARKAELEDQYRKAVLTAFQEVQDALAARERADAQTAALTTAVEQSQAAYALARTRFDAGATDFLTLLDAQRSLLSAQDALTGARLAQFTARIDLFKALGGVGRYS
jgi:NodT family efflux transporter outer membrane factor (OMF) lipoprotein